LRLAREYMGEALGSECLAHEALRMGEETAHARPCEHRDVGEGAPQAILIRQP